MLNHLSKFFFIFSDKKKNFLLILCFSLVASLIEVFGIGLVGPFMALATDPETINRSIWLRWLYSQSGVSSIRYFIALFGAAIVIVFYIKSFIYFYIQRYIFSFSFSQMTKLQSKLLNAYLTIPYVFHLNKNSAVLIQNIAIESEHFCLGFMIPLLNSSTSAVVLLALTLLLVKTNPIATLGIAFILLFSFIFYIKTSSVISAWGKSASQTQTEIIQIVKHALGGLKEVRVLGCESYFEDQIKFQARIHADSRTQFNVFKFLPRISIEALLITFLVGFTSISLLTNDVRNLTSVLGVFAIASIRIIPTLSRLMTALSTIRNNFYPLDKIYMDLVELDKYEKLAHQNLVSYRKTSKVNASKTIPTINETYAFNEQVELDSITYFYPYTNEPAIQNVSLSFKKGQSIALIGQSGAGKTTLVDILLGLLSPKSGDILVDGVSIYRKIRAWQNLIGYIPQSIFLMDDTIEKNIAFGVPNSLIDKNKVSNAVSAAQLSELVDELPDGLHTVVGEQGVRLSGGQRQRIGIARALYHEREILVLDEATASLDTETEKLVSQSIQSLSSTKTMIIIAHRLSTVEHCDCIYEFRNGCLVNSGSYQDVVLGN